MATPEELRRQVEELKKEFELLDDTFKSIGSSLQQNIQDNLELVDESSQGVVKSLGNDLRKAIERSSKALDNQNSLLNEIGKGRNVSKKVENEILKIEKERDTILRKINTIKKLGGAFDSEAIANLKEGLNIQIDNLESIGEINDETQKQSGLYKLIGNNLGKIADNFDRTGTLSKVISGNLAEVLTFTRLSQAFFALLVKSTFDASTNIANIAKSTGLSYQEAVRLQKEFALAAFESEKLFLTSRDLNKSFAELSAQTGLIADFGGKTLVTQSTLTKQLGLSAEQAGKLSLLSRLQSTNTEGVLDNVVSTVGAISKQNGVALNAKSILEGISNVSAAIAVSLGKNPVEIGKAVAQAKLLGISLNEVDGIASSLLNFEESITAELQAELLIGKNLNLERARLLALNNDLAGLAEEIRNQEEIRLAFANGNRLAQEAAAKAIGVSRDQLAKIALQQDINNLSAERFRDTYGEVTYQQLQSQSAGEKFASLAEKIQGIVGDIAVVFSPFLDYLAQAANYLTKNKVAATALVGILTSLAAISVGKAIADTISSFAQFGGVGAIAGIAAAAGIAGLVVGAISQVKSSVTADDMIMPAGYGDRILSTPAGSIALNNQDTIVAGTNLGGGDNREAKETNRLLRQILTKQGTVRINTTDAGTAFAINTFEVQ